MDGACKPQSIDWGLTLAVLQLVNGTQHTDRQGSGLHRIRCLCSFQAYLHRSQSVCFLVFCCVHIPVQFAAYQSFIIFHSANLALLTCPCLSRFFPRSVSAPLFRFPPSPGVPNDQIPSTTMGLGVLGVDITIRVVQQLACHHTYGLHPIQFAAASLIISTIFK